MDAFWLHCEEKQFSVDDMCVTKDIYDVVKSREVHGITDSELQVCNLIIVVWRA